MKRRNKMKSWTDCDDLKELTFEFNNDPLELTSKIYPITLKAIKGEGIVAPHLYYEGVAMSNRGPVKVTIPRLDLIIGSITNNVLYEYDYDGITHTHYFCSESMRYEIITKMQNKPGNVLIEVKLFDKEDWEQAKDFFGIEVKEK
jgi:hypothetical protein